MNERGVLQGVVGVLAMVPVLAGTAGLVAGPGFVGIDPPWSGDLDSHFRYLSGLLLALGLAWWSCVPEIETKGERFRLLAGWTVVGVSDVVGLASVVGEVVVWMVYGKVVGLGRSEGVGKQPKQARKGQFLSKVVEGVRMKRA